MKKIIHKNLLGMLKSKGVLAISGSMLMVSCTIQTGGYSETDGVYYDPNTDTLPQGVAMDEGNQVGDIYDYQNNGNIVEKSKQNEEAKRNRYRSETWSDKTQNDSDWGAYAGTETNIYNNWGSSFGMGYGYPRYGWGSYFGLSYGWGNPWTGSFYDPFWGYGYGSSFGYYFPYYYGSYYGYSPYYYGYSPYYYGSPYGYGGYYGNTYYAAPRRSRGADGLINTGTGRGATYKNNNSGFRTQGSYSGRTMYPGNTSAAQPRMRATQPRTESRSYPQQQPVYRENTSRSESTMRSSDSGFRSGGGFNSGNMSSGSTSRSGGGFRTGGGR